MALLEADVALPVVRDFIARVKDKALGQEVVGSLTPGQALVGIVQPRTRRDDGRAASADLNLATQPPAVILMAGLQGAGKTTTTAKLAKHLIEKRKKKVLTVSADVYRPAAIEQLKTVTQQAGAEWFPSDAEQKPRDIALAALDYAKRHYFDVLLVDTAGRLAHRRSADGRDPRTARGAEAGRDAVRRRRDAGPGRDQHRQGLQGRAAADRHRADQARRRLARRRGAVGAPGHRRADQVRRRVARRSTAWRSSTPSATPAACSAWATSWRWSRRCRRASTSRRRRSWPTRSSRGGGFDLNDFLSQISQMKKMGGLSGLMDKLPSQLTAKAAGADMDRAERDVRRMEGIICSMTPLERRKPELHQGQPQAPHRRRRRRAGAGSEPPAQPVRADAGHDEEDEGRRPDEDDEAHGRRRGFPRLMRSRAAAPPACAFRASRRCAPRRRAATLGYDFRRWRVDRGALPA